MKHQKKLRFWVNSTGTTQIDGRWVKFGLEGSSDIIGIIKPSGRFLAIEIKSEKGRQSEAQKKFESMIKSFGGIYILAKDCDGITSVLKDEEVI
jgi:hypothetical protein